MNLDKSVCVISITSTLVSVHDTFIISSSSLAGQVNDGITLFTYPAGMSSADFAHPEHQPDYLTDVLQSAHPDVVSFCDNDPQCIFDYSETMDEAVAQTTMEVDGNNTENQEIQSEYISKA